MNFNCMRNTKSSRVVVKKKKQKAFIKIEDAIKMLIQQKKAVNFSTVSKEAGVSRQQLYSQPFLRSKIETLRQQQKASASHTELPQCPKCFSLNVIKNGHRPNGKQGFKCLNCSRQFIVKYEVRGYTLQVKECCLKLHSWGMSLRSIERATGVCHTTILTWVKQVNVSSA